MTSSGLAFSRTFSSVGPPRSVPSISWARTTSTLTNRLNPGSGVGAVTIFPGRISLVLICNFRQLSTTNGGEGHQAPHTWHRQGFLSVYGISRVIDCLHR